VILLLSWAFLAPLLCLYKCRVVDDYLMTIKSSSFTPWSETLDHSSSIPECMHRSYTNRLVLSMLFESARIWTSSGWPTLAPRCYGTSVLPVLPGRPVLRARGRVFDLGGINLLRCESLRDESTANITEQSLQTGFS
jgi:hypothetical protein